MWVRFPPGTVCEMDVTPEYVPALAPDGNGNGWKQVFAFLL
jgi:hypothetical protein